MVPIAFVIAEQDETITAIVLEWVGVLLVAASCVAGYFLRRAIFGKDTKHRPGFTIEQIDRLHDEGTLTEEEYRLARRSALGLTDPDTPE